MRSIRISCFLLFLIPFIIVKGSATEVTDKNYQSILLDDGQETYAVASAMSYLEDKTGNLTLEDIVSLNESNRFIPAKHNQHSFGYTRSAYWVNFRVQNPSFASRELLLVLTHPFMKRIHLYYSENGNPYIKRVGGIQLRRTPQAYKSRNHVFEIDFPPQSETVFFMRFENGGPMSIPLTLWSVKAFMNQPNSDRILLGLFYGIFVALLIYNITIFFFLGDRSYIYYGIYLIVMIVYLLAADGIGYQYFWQGSEWFSVNSILLWNLLILTYINFSRSFLATLKNTPRLDRVLKLLVALLLFNIILSQAVDMILSLKITLVVQLATTFLLIWVSGICIRQGYRPAKFYFVAMLLFLTGSLLTLLKNAGAIPENLITIWGVHWGSTIEILLLSIGLADRINTLKREKIQAQKTSIEAKQLAINTLKQTEKRINQVFDNAVEGIFQYDEAHRLIFANPAMARIFGFDSVQELMAKTPDIEDLFESPADSDSVIQQLQSYNSYISYDTPFIKKNRDQFVGTISIRRIKDPDHGNIYAEGMVLDVTDRVLREKVERELEIAEQANQAKSEFLANVAHELRTPMHVVLAYAKLGVSRIETNKKDKILEYFKAIDSSGVSLLNLINDLLDVSKLEANSVEYTFSRQRLSVLTDIVIKELLSISQPKEVTVSLNSPGFDDTAEIDADKIIQVIRNLIANAVRFSEQKSDIIISIEEQNADLLFTIRDQGIGIPPAELETIFGQFVQSSLTKTRDGGTGLGLSISKKIIEDHHGIIWAENGPAKGAIFKFQIPRQKNDHQ